MRYDSFSVGDVVIERCSGNDRLSERHHNVHGIWRKRAMYESSVSAGADRGGKANNDF
jgi:hypothetical protein